jgi:hypothetical protein
MGVARASGADRYRREARKPARARAECDALTEAGFLALLHPDDAALLRVALGEAIRSERELAQEFRIHREDTRELRWLGYQDRVVVRQALDEAVVLTGLAFE